MNKRYFQLKDGDRFKKGQMVTEIYLPIIDGTKLRKRGEPYLKQYSYGINEKEFFMNLIRIAYCKDIETVILKGRHIIENVQMVHTIASCLLKNKDIILEIDCCGGLYNDEEIERFAEFIENCLPLNIKGITLLSSGGDFDIERIINALEEHTIPIELKIYTEKGVEEDIIRWNLAETINLLSSYDMNCEKITFNVNHYRQEELRNIREHIHFSVFHEIGDCKGETFNIEDEEFFLLEAGLEFSLDPDLVKDFMEEELGDNYVLDDEIVSNLTVQLVGLSRELYEVVDKTIYIHRLILLPNGEFAISNSMKLLDPEYYAELELDITSKNSHTIYIN